MPLTYHQSVGELSKNCSASDLRGRKINWCQEELNLSEHSWTCSRLQLDIVCPPTSSGIREKNISNNRTMALKCRELTYLERPDWIIRFKGLGFAPAPAHHHLHLREDKGPMGSGDCELLRICAEGHVPKVELFVRVRVLNSEKNSINWPSGTLHFSWAGWYIFIYIPIHGKRLKTNNGESKFDGNIYPKASVTPNMSHIDLDIPWTIFLWATHLFGR